MQAILPVKGSLLVDLEVITYCGVKKRRLLKNAPAVCVLMI